MQEIEEQGVSTATPITNNLHSWIKKFILFI